MGGHNHGALLVNLALSELCGRGAAAGDLVTQSAQSRPEVYPLQRAVAAVWPPAGKEGVMIDATCAGGLILASFLGALVGALFGWLVSVAALEVLDRAIQWRRGRDHHA
jgi:hypothetical protein